MTDTADRTLISRDTEPAAATGLARYQPANLKQLAWLAGEVAKSGMYLVSTPEGTRPMTQPETMMVMIEGAEIGLTPMQSMRNFYGMVDKRGRFTSLPRADLFAARILADPRTERWEPDTSQTGMATLTAQRHGHAPVTMSMRIAEVPSRDRDKWQRNGLDAQEMMLNRLIRRMTRQYFKDMVLGLNVGNDDSDSGQVIDVAAVERVSGVQDGGACPECGGHRMRLVTPRAGGVFSACDECGHTGAPPQSVRDAVRGYKDDPAHPLHVEEVMPTAAELAGPERVTAPAAEEVQTAAGGPPDDLQSHPFLPAEPDTEDVPLDASDSMGLDTTTFTEGEPAATPAPPTQRGRTNEAMAIRPLIHAALMKLPNRERTAAQHAAGWPRDGAVTWPEFLDERSPDELREIEAFLSGRRNVLGESS